MARVLVALKFRLLANSIRATGTRAVLGLALSLVLALVTGVIGGLLLLAIRLAPVHHRGDLLAAGFAVLLVVWVLGPIVTAAGETTLEVANLSLLPLSRRDVMPGLLLGAAVGFGGVSTVLVLTGAVGATATGPTPATAIVLAAALAQLGTCVASSRLAATALSSAARSRRWRDVVLFAGPVLALAANVAVQLVLRSAGPSAGSPGRLPDWVRVVVRVLPSGLPATAMSEASAGRLGLAMVALAGSVAIVWSALALWARAIERILTTAAGSSPSAAKRAAGPSNLFPALVGFLPRGRSGAVAARDLRLAWRDPRQRAAYIASAFAAALPFIGVRLTTSPDPRLALVAAVPAYFLAATATNQFGYDGPAHWTNVAAGDDIGADLVGKNVARAAIALPMVIVAAAVLSLRAGSAAYLVPAVGLGAAVFATVLGLANLCSVVAPFPMPSSTTNVYATGLSGQAIAAALPSFALVLGAPVVVAPVVVPLVVAPARTPVLLGLTAVALAYGAAGWWLGWRAAVRRSGPRQPELLDALGRREGA